MLMKGMKIELDGELLEHVTDITINCPLYAAITATVTQKFLVKEVVINGNENRISLMSISLMSSQGKR